MYKCSRFCACCGNHIDDDARSYCNYTPTEGMTEFCSPDCLLIYEDRRTRNDSKGTNVRIINKAIVLPSTFVAVLCIISLILSVIFTIIGDISAAGRCEGVGTMSLVLWVSIKVSNMKRK